MHCPYCYNRIGKRLWFQCEGVGTPGRPGCQPVLDERRAQLTGFNQLVHPSFPGPRYPMWSPRYAYCPHDGGRTGIRVCPECHTPLPTYFADSDSPMIAMWGATGTGKTAYLTVLANDLRRTMSARFDAGIRLVAVGQGGENSPLRWLQDHVEQLFTQRKLPTGTASSRSSNGRQEPLVFEWRRARNGRLPLGSRFKTTYLSFYDTAGEDVEPGQRMADLRYLRAARALILLLDPFMLPEVRDRIHVPESALRSTSATVDVVSELTNALRECHGVPERGRIGIPLAVAFAKIDAFFEVLGENSSIRRAPPLTAKYDEREGWMTHHQIRSQLWEWGGSEIDKLLEKNFTTYRYFAVSALGRPPNYETGTLREGAIRPHRIDEPLVWLLSRFHMVGVQGRRQE